MRILQFGVYPPPEGGVQTNVKDIRDYLTAQGVPSGVIHLSRHRQLDGNGIFYPKTALAVIQKAVSFPADIWHFHLGGSVTRSLLGLYAFGTSIPSRKTVLSFHSGGYPSSPDGQRTHPLRDFVFRRFDRIIAVNRNIAEMFTRIGVDRERIRLIPPFALPSQPPLAEIPPAIAHFMGRHSPLLVAICGLEPEYDIALQIHTMERIITRFPGAGLIIIGGGSMEQVLLSQIASKPYARSILLCGDVPRSVTLNVLVGADVFLRTTWYDGDAVSVREALHFGVPVIASDNGMRPEGVVLVPPRDRDALAAAVDTLLTRPRAPRTPSPGTNENLQAVLDLYKELV